MSAGCRGYVPMVMITETRITSNFA